MSETTNTVAPEEVATFRPYCLTEPSTFEIAESLLKKLTWLNKVIESKPVTPIIENLHFYHGVIYATDLSITAMHYTNIKGDFLVPAKTLAELLKNLDKKDEVSFNNEGENKLWLVVNGEKTFGFSADDRKNFPQIPVKETNLPVGEIKSEGDMEALQTALKYVSKDKLRAAMCGVFVNAQEVASTNGHWLFTSKLKETVISEPEYSFVMPAKAITILNGFAYAKMQRDDNNTNILFKQEKRAVLFRRIDERYPDYKNVIPSHNHVSVKLDKKKFKDALKLGAQAANKATWQMAFQFNEGGKFVKVSAENPDFGTEFYRTIPAAIEWGNLRVVGFEKVLDGEGNPIKDDAGITKVEEKVTFEAPAPEQQFAIGFNLKFMTQIVNDIESNIIELKMAAANKAILVNNDVLIMPIMLNQYV